MEYFNLLLADGGAIQLNIAQILEADLTRAPDQYHKKNKIIYIIPSPPETEY